MESLYESLMGKTVVDKLSEANHKICALEQELVDADTKLVETNAKLDVVFDKNWDLEQNKRVTVHELNLALEVTPQKLEEFRGVGAIVLRTSMYEKQYTSVFEEMYSMFSSLSENIVSNYKLNNKKEK